jgi:hypothetical protein
MKSGSFLHIAGFSLLVLLLSACGRKDAAPLSPVPAPTEAERMLCDTLWLVDSMHVDGRNTLLHYANVVSGSDTNIVGFNYTGNSMTFLINHKVWWRNVTCFPWLDIFWPEKALEDWSLRDDGSVLSVSFDYARPMLKADWKVLLLSSAQLRLQRAVGPVIIDLFCSSGKSDQNVQQNLAALIDAALYKSWRLEAHAVTPLPFTDSLLSILFSRLTNGAGFADIAYRTSGTFRVPVTSYLHVLALDEVPSFGMYLKYSPIPGAAPTWFLLLSLGDRKLELMEETTKQRLYFSAP